MEYFARQRLSKLGFTSSFDSLDPDTAEAFLLIDGEMESMKAKMMKRSGR